MIDQNNQIVQISVNDFLKTDFNVTRLKFNALKLLHELELSEELGEECYIKHEIPKHDGTKRMLYEPKPLLKEIQKQLLNLLYTLKKHRDYPVLSRNIKYKYLPTRSSTAYLKGSSVVKNANFHIGKDVVVKLDISNFFNSIPKNKIELFWFDILNLKVKYLIHLGIIEKDETEDKKHLIISGLAKKVLSSTTLNGFLPQGSPTSGYIANSYLVSFDKKMLEFCVNKSLCYSRYSDDITVSGSNSELVSKQVIKFVQHQLYKKSLKLKKSKTKVLKRHKRQTVTGIVVNEKRSAGRAFKRGLRMQMYYLKKFGLDHVSRTHSNINRYLLELAGKVNWVLQVNKVDPEFKRYKGELYIIKRFLALGKTVGDATNYISELENKDFKIKNNSVFIAGLFWRISDDDTQTDYPSIDRKNKSVQLFTEESIELALKNNPGWRLPTMDEFNNFIKETNFEDRRVLGIRYPFDPHFNGLADENGYRYYNRVGLYWTSDLAHLSKERSTKDRIARKAICFLSFDQKIKKKINQNTACYISSKTFSLSVNKKQKFELTNNRSIDYYLNPPLNEDFQAIVGACSIRLVMSEEMTKKTMISKTLWDSIQLSKFSVDLSNLNLEELSFSLKNFNASSILLYNNNIKHVNLTEIAPVKRIDLRNNKLESIKLNNLPKGVKHIRLEENKDLKLLDIPWKRLLQSSHELTADQLIFERQKSLGEFYLSALGGESWRTVSSDHELNELVDSKNAVEFLKVRFEIGTNKIDSKELFNRLSKLEAIHLFIEFETNHEQINQLIHRLKMSFGSITPLNEHLNSLERDNNHQENIFMKQYVFNASDLKNIHLKSLIFDFSWIPNIKFIGDFHVKPDLYHLLHPGTSFTNLPATSVEFHRPNILVKVFGEKRIGNEQTHLHVTYPFDSIVEKHQNIQTIIPKNQIFIDELILVLSNENEKELQKGQIEEHFPKLYAINRYNSKTHASKLTTNLVSSKRVSGFPLLGFALQFDVHKLSVPLESFYKKDKLLFNPERLKREKGPIMDWTEVNFNQKIHSEKKTRLGKENLLSDLDIFSHKKESKPPTIPPSDDRPLNRPYIIKHGVFAKHKLYSASDNSRNKVMTMLASGEIAAKHLPSKLKNDEEVMLIAIKRNPYSMVFASKRLKENPSFLLKACEISARTLVFLPKKLATKQVKSDSIFNQLIDYLLSFLTPAEFHFVIHKLGTHISQSDGEYRYFTCEETALEKSHVISSFESEVFYQESTTRAGMPNIIRKTFLSEA
ncbi:MAG: reverse transcriptase domain-containing protein, partial [Bacteroidota bacterium]